MPNAMNGLARLRAYTSRRVSSENDDFASNEDYWWVEPGETRAILDVAGCVLFLDTGIQADRDGYLAAMKERFPDNAYRRHWWEGDDRIHIDGELAIRGTGTEDYFGSAWSYASERPFTAPQFGCVMNGYDPRDHGRWCLYRWHLDAPIAFRESLRVTIEHGHDNRFTLAPYHAVAYWYQARGGDAD